MDKKHTMELADEELEARLRKADFSEENPGLEERLWGKITKRLRGLSPMEDNLEDVELSSEELSQLAAARGPATKGRLGSLDDWRKPPQ